jgi:hypothetical protein
MLKLFDFKCPKGHISEHLVQSDVKELSCVLCDESAKRVISPIRSQLPANQGFPDADRRWIKDHESRGGTRKVD